MTTKQRILQQAITSYNENGLMNVTSRSLASDLGISHGNLEYHFPNKEALIKAIYKQMRKEISGIYKLEDEAVNPFVRFNNLLLELEHFNIKYSFFNLDVLEISRNYPEVNKLLKQTFLIRSEQEALFYRRFKECNYFKDETVPGMYKRLQHTVRILITFWNSQQSVLPKQDTSVSMSVYIWELLVPHMTDAGLAAYYDLKK
ncbi:MAG: TetR/AcrR family transcriptional regulator [Flavobacteriaceae bacterium]